MSKLRRVVGWVLALVVLALPLFAWWHWQSIYDWFRLRDYSPPAAIASLASQDTMTPAAKHLFYINHPNLEDNGSQFRADCNESEKTIVLGCYHGGEAGIYIYDVTDPRLEGVQQVTAAHEMLHAAYDRLSAKDKDYVDGLLEDYYDHDLKDQRIKDTIAAYRQSEPNDVVNEMHSVFGTEIANLPAPLENYYNRYFSDRQVVAHFAAKYQGEFNKRQSEIKTDDASLASQKQRITVEENNLNQQADQIDSDRSHLDSLRSSGQIAAYNAAVPGFNAEVTAYNAGVQKLKDDISAYNDLVNQRNAIAADLASLQQSLDTRLTTQSTQ